MCRLLGVSTSGFYASVDRPLSTRAKRDLVLSAKLEAAHDESRGTYGAPRLHAELVADGEKVGRKSVARLMRKVGLVGISPRKSTFTTVRDPAGRPSDDLVRRDFTATGPDQLWVADITYVPTWAGFLYLAVVLDVWSRRIVGWAMSTSLKTDVVLDALNMTVTQRQPRNVVHHSDHGCQLGFKWSSQQACVARKQAFGRRWGPSATRTTTRCARASSAPWSASCSTAVASARRREARMAVFDYLEGFYNPRRRHSALDYKSPIEYERSHALAA